jgi:hypothetical protein
VNSTIHINGTRPIMVEDPTFTVHSDNDGNDAGITFCGIHLQVVGHRRHSHYLSIKKIVEKMSYAMKVVSILSRESYLFLATSLRLSKGIVFSLLQKSAKQSRKF